MKKIYTLAALAAMIVLGASCNSEWTEEQYEHYISFSSRLDSKGVTNIYVPYSRHDKDGNYAEGGEGRSNYQLPVLVSGSTDNAQNLTIHIAHDPDTLGILNYARYATREELYYKDMGMEGMKYASYSETLPITAGQNKRLLDIKFDFRNIDMSEKWVLPLQIVDDPSYGYQSHPRKDYAKAILRIFPFNDYSGDYSGTGLTNKVVTGYDNKGNPIETAESITKASIRGYVVDEQNIFTYAGIVDEDYTDRKDYKIKFTFNGDKNGPVTLYCENAEKIGFEVNKEVTPSFRVSSSMDEARPYLEHRYVIINNIDYYFNYMPVEGTSIRYHVKGTLTLSRDINTQIPDEDQAIEW
ncbi:DUF4973 domain-containing protein [Bacteroides sp.]|uniref:DUF4973 domain-containing protein n=1 Tax=Bacteroides sp. TaxID=29523 RepID=UPI00262BC187|nr:DUF4973 domain-containing protein [Bacteroides sp.]MDD3038276.1 DUF4973 domain-containing protein [Bacteroides sp.]